MNKIFLSCGSIVCAGALLSVNFFAMPVSALSQEQSDAISQNCSSIKQSLKQLQKADSSTRVFLGTAYEHILSNFISPLNIRLAKNNRPDTTLSNVQTQFANQRRQFNDSFTEYMKSLDTLTSVDCVADPASFYNRLTETRTRRAKVHQTTVELRKLTDQLYKSTNSIRESL